MKQLITSLLSLLLLSGMVSCLKKEPTVWEIQAGAPLIQTELTLQNLLADSLLSVDESGNLALNITLSYALVPDDSLFKIQNITVADSFQIPFALTVPPGTQFYNINRDVQFDAGNARITYMFLSEGTAFIKARSTVNQPVVFDYQLQNASNLQGQPLGESNFTLAAGSTTNPALYEKMVPLAGYGFNLTGNGNQYNRTKAILNVKVADDAANADLAQNQVLFKTETILSGAKPYYVKGFFGTRDITIEPTFAPIEFLNSISGLLEFSEASLSIDVINSIGADFTLKIDELTAIRNNQEVSLNTGLIGQTILLNRAQEIPSSFSAQYTPFIRQYLINSANSNLLDFIQFLPSALRFKGSCSINPFGNISAGNDFFYNDGKGGIKLNLRIPLKFKAQQLSFADTLAFTPITANQSQPFKGGELYIHALNSFPMDLKLKLGLHGEAKNLLTEISTNDKILASTLVNLSGQLQGQVSTVRFPLPEQLKTQLEATKFISIKATLDTKPDNEWAELESYQKCKLTIGARINYEVQAE